MKDLLASILILASGVALGLLVRTVTRQDSLLFQAGAGFLVGLAWGIVGTQIAIHCFGRFTGGRPR